MTKSKLLCGAVLTAIPLFASAKEFPLEYKTLSAEEAMSFPGGSGLYGSVQLGKPSAITREPAAISKRPLYGQMVIQTNGMWFRIDESKGTGQGYDRLLVDMNRNGDLTDDTSAPRVEQPGQPSRTSLPEIAYFGPIPAPDNKKIGESRPIYFAQFYLYTRPADLSLSRGGVSGQLRMKPGWYLETKVELEGVTQKVLLIDGNCNSRLGDSEPPTLYRDGTETRWYFQGGDYFLNAPDRSGRLQSALLENEATPFGPVLYVGAKPYKAALATDSKSLSVEPWSGPLAELALQHGDQVSAIQVAWESAPGEWRLIQPGIENGKAKVPAGNYRLYTCTLKAKSANGDALRLSGYNRTMKDTTKADAGVSTPFKCGSPLEIKVTSERDTSSTAQSGSILGRIVRSFAGSDGSVQQLIQASVYGAGGEMYSGFYIESKGSLHSPPAPAFTVTTADGKQVGSGNMEFGWGGVCSHSWRVPKELIGKTVTIKVKFDLAPVETTSKPIDVKL